MLEICLILTNLTLVMLVGFITRIKKKTECNFSFFFFLHFLTYEVLKCFLIYIINKNITLSLQKATILFKKRKHLRLNENSI